MHPMLNIAFGAARNAGKVMLRYLDRLDEVTITKKAHNDFVSEVDLQSERIIVETLQKCYPDHGILTEESGQISQSDDYLWIIDPLDGTRNYLHGLPLFAISIALMHKGQVILGLVYDPLREELFSAARGEGARLNEHRIRVAKRVQLAECLVGTGFPAAQDDHCLAMFTRVLLHASDVRCTGSAALNLAYVAAGRLDAFWEIHLKSWDIAAGSLLVKEAGGFVSDIFGREEYLQSGHIIAGNRKTHPALLKEIAPFSKLVTPDQA